jgi:uncharacterized protein (DUF305 family)
MRFVPPDPRTALQRCALIALLIGVASTSLAQMRDPAASAHAPAAAGTVPDRQKTADEAPFLAENDAAMRKMMADMAAKPTGDVDRDFVAMMAPHHQGAIDMAQALLRHGSNEQLKRLAQEIIVTQQQEIAVMRLAIGEPPESASDPATAMKNTASTR